MEFTAPSGVKVEITISDYSLCFDLLRAVRKVGKSETIDVIIDPEVDRLLYKCLERATYNNLKITRDTFEPEKARADYIFIADKALDVNLLPFVSHQLSGLKDISQGKNSSPTSK